MQLHGVHLLKLPMPFPLQHHSLLCFLLHHSQPLCMQPLQLWVIKKIIHIHFPETRVWSSSGAYQHFLCPTCATERQATIPCGLHPCSTDCDAGSYVGVLYARSYARETSSTIAYTMYSRYHVQRSWKKSFLELGIKGQHTGCAVFCIRLTSLDLFIDMAIPFGNLWLLLPSLGRTPSCASCS